MARTKMNGVRDYNALFKARTGVDRHPPVNATAEQLAKHHADWSRLRAKWAREEERATEERMKKSAEWIEAYSAKMDIEEKEKPRRPCFECSRRKKKCDRADFCGRCRKHNAYICMYPAE